jgi:DNA-binding NarL/FixJ family response regulator
MFNTKKLVLLVEDDIVCLDFLLSVFSKMHDPWQVHSVNNGGDALAMLNKGKLPCTYNLAIVDIGLPDMSGLDVIASAHQSHPNLPILVSSSFNTEATLLAAIKAGAHGYLLKSDSDVSLVQAIERVLSGEFPVSPALARYLFKLAGYPETAPEKGTLLKLSRREQVLLQHIANGNSYLSCAELMHISLSTVQTHIRNIYRKLDVRNGRQAINKAIFNGLIRL